MLDPISELLRYVTDICSRFSVTCNSNWIIKHLSKVFIYFYYVLVGGIFFYFALLYYQTEQ